MDCYKVQIQHSAEHEIRKIPKTYLTKIIEAIRELAHNPFPMGYRKLQGMPNSYRIRIGDYRVIYQIDTVLRIISISHVRHRKDAYKK